MWALGVAFFDWHEHEFSVQITHRHLIEAIAVFVENRFFGFLVFFPSSRISNMNRNQSIALNITKLNRLLE